MALRPTEDYPKPPITEAVIEIRFATPISHERVERAADKLGKAFARSLPNVEVNVHVDLDTNVADFRKTPDGVRLFSNDGADILFLRPLGMAWSRLPPYEGWDTLVAKAKKQWAAFIKAVGRREIARVGVRFINRIDVPAAGGSAISVEEFLNIHTDLPEKGLFLSNFTKQLQIQLADNQQMVVNIASAPPALVDHYSFLLDIDVSTEKLPQDSDEGVWEAVERIRPLKNKYFEYYITDATRNLFR